MRIARVKELSGGDENAGSDDMRTTRVHSQIRVRLLRGTFVNLPLVKVLADSTISLRHRISPLGIFFHTLCINMLQGCLHVFHCGIMRCVKEKQLGVFAELPAQQ